MKKISQIYLLITLILTSGNALAKKKKITKQSVATRTQTSLVVDAESGKILHNINGHQKIYPASLTKLMTLYLTFDAIERNKLRLDQKLPVSYNAQKMKPSKLGLVAGETIATRDAILSLIIKSANDAAVVLAEAIGKNEMNFAAAMTQKAHQLGMKNSNFSNASGWHHPEQKTTATDLAKLTLAIKRDFPQFYPWFSKDSFIFKGKTVKGHNNVASNYPGAEGMKTGYTVPAGFNLVTTASRDGKSLIGIVTGSNSAALRDKKMTKLLNAHFSDYSPGVYVTSGSENKLKSEAIIKKVNIAKTKPKVQLKKYAAIKKVNQKSSTVKKPTKKVKSVNA